MRAALVGVLAAGIGVGLAREAQGICREVGEPGMPPPTMEPDQSVLIVKRDDAVIGRTCEPVAGADAGALDAGAPPTDAGAADAGARDAAVPDAGVVCEDVRGPAIRMVVQPRFRTGASGAQFALLMVTPADPVIALEQPGVFAQLAELTKQRIVVEDVCIETTDLGYQCKDPQWPSVTGSCANPPDRPPRTPDRPSTGRSGGGCGGGSSAGDDDEDWFPWQDAAPSSDLDAGPPAVQTIGAYDVVEVRTTSLDQLAAWLTQLGYAYEQADLDALAPYVAASWTVIAVRISVDSSFAGGLEPLSFSYAGSEIRLPIGVSQQPPPAEAHLAVYVAADGRYDLPGAAQPYARWTTAGGGSFLTRNDLWADLSRGAADDPVAGRVDGDPEQSNTVTVTREIRIPSSECPLPPPDPDPPPDSRGCSGDDDDDSAGSGSSGDGGGSGCGCRAADFPTPGGAILIAICAAALLRPRRRRSARRGAVLSCTGRRRRRPSRRSRHRPGRSP